MNPKQIFYQNQAQTIIQHLEKRNMKGYYFETSEEAKDFIQNFIPDHSTVSWGGSTTLQEIGMVDAFQNRDLNLLDRSVCKSREELEQLYRRAFSADYYLMSTNAITLDGKLINIDGLGNRVASLIFGPKQVLIVAGMNKVACDESSAIKRVQNFASPPNTNRLNLKTPCSKTGVCMDCQSKDCICCEIVITRRSKSPERIHVLLIGEELGY